MALSPYLAAVRSKVGHDLLTLTAASVLVYDEEGRLLLAEDAETGLWTLPGGAIDPEEAPADAAVRECYEETGLLVQIEALIGVFGGPEFLVTYPNRDVAYYTVIAFQARAIGGSHQADGVEVARLQYFHRSECDHIALSPSSRVVVQQAFSQGGHSYFAKPTWLPDQA
ncbi:NUDIX domain-containing protein [Tardiphaga sp. 71_E8_N1_1]|jgi:8-oxo-dGTP pyrophosphatase MutT (NUDIX family)|uniref:NUDIX domain-containing protein n=1 Tax=Tardiphaga sp. 71_E8_N1_1 TaxID=3240784 RepID=UPI000E70846C